MNKTIAIAVLVLFGAGAIAIAWWGSSDNSTAKLAIRSCTDRITLDISAFWFLGLICIAYLPALAVVPDRFHRLLFLAMLVTVFAAPFGSYLQLRSLAQAHNYDISDMPSLFSFQEFSLQAMSECLSD